MIVKKSLRRLSVVIKTRFMIGLSLNLSVLMTSGVSIDASLIRVSITLFNGPEIMTSAASKVELFVKQFSYNSTLDGTVYVLPEIQPRTDVNLSSIYIITKMVADVINYLDSSKATGSDEIPVVVLQKYSPELFPILCSLFRKSIEEYWFSNH